LSDEAAARAAAIGAYYHVHAPGNWHPLDPRFSNWFLSRQENTSTLWSANCHGRSEVTINTVNNNNQRLAKWNIARFPKLRQEAARLHGGHCFAEIKARFPRVINELLKGNTIAFGHSPRLAYCNTCGEPDIGTGQNTIHRCSANNDKKSGFKIILKPRGNVQPNFSQYLLPLYVHASGKSQNGPN
jgi:hypothetical protein